MLKDKLLILSAVSLFLYAVVRFCEEALETALRVRLICAQVSFSGTDWQINGGPLRFLLLILAAVCLAAAIVSAIFDVRRGARK